MKVEKMPYVIHICVRRYSKGLPFFTNDIHDYLVNDKHIRVPSYFDTDLASIPRLLWPIIAPIGKHSIAALMHDYIYSHRCELNIHRKEADDMFYYVMLASGVNKSTAKLLYYCVRLFGASRWKKD